MGKVATFIYGILLIGLGLASFFDILSLYLAYIVFGLAILIMLTEITPFLGIGVVAQRTAFKFIRRWFIPIFMIIMASPDIPLLNFIYAWLNGLGWLDLSYIILGSWSAAVLLILFGVIYLAAIFGRANVNVTTH